VVTARNKRRLGSQHKTPRIVHISVDVSWLAEKIIAEVQREGGDAIPEFEAYLDEPMTDT